MLVEFAGLVFVVWASVIYSLDRRLSVDTALLVVVAVAIVASVDFDTKVPATVAVAESVVVAAVLAVAVASRAIQLLPVLLTFVCTVTSVAVDTVNVQLDTVIADYSDTVNSDSNQLKNYNRNLGNLVVCTGQNMTEFYFYC